MILIDGIEYRPYDHLYAVSRCGKVVRCYKPYSPTLHNGGYAACGRRRLLHRMIAHVWIRPPNKGEHVHHINRNKQDNRVENLEIINQRSHNIDRNPEIIKKLSKSGISEEGKEKLRQLRQGTTMPQETKKKISETLKKMGHRPAPRYGKLSKEELKKRKETPARSTPCTVNGVRYISFAAASEATGVHRFTIRKRCHSPNFPEFQLDSD